MAEAPAAAVGYLVADGADGRVFNADPETGAERLRFLGTPVVICGTIGRVAYRHEVGPVPRVSFAGPHPRRFFWTSGTDSWLR
jgi:hypothetical protein